MLVAISFDKSRVIEQEDGLIVLDVPNIVRNNHAFRVLTMEGKTEEDYWRVMRNMEKPRSRSPRIKRAKSIWVGQGGGLIVEEG